MSSENEGSENKQNVAETKKEKKPKKELTPQEIQKRKKMLVYPLFFLLFAGAMWLIFAPSGGKDKQQTDGLNSELPVPKDEAIVGNKRAAYEQEAMRNKEEQKRRSLQDFTFMLSEEENSNQVNITPDYEDTPSNAQSPRNAIQSSAHAYQDVNRQLSSWYEQPETNVNEQAQTELALRVEELERKLTEAEAAKSAEDKQLELIEKSYQIAAKYSPGGQTNPEGQQVQTASNSMTEKVIPKPVSQVHHNIVSLLAAPMSNDDFMEQYSKPRNMGFITAAMFAEERAFHASSTISCFLMPFSLLNLLIKASMIMIVTTGKSSRLSLILSISNTIKLLESRSIFSVEFNRKSYRPPR
jgi:conjugative transposon TraM protein